MLYVWGCVRFGGFTAWLRVCMELVGYLASQVAFQSVLSIYCICLYIIYVYICLHILYMFHSLVEGLHGVSGLLSKSSSCQSVYPPISDKLTTHSIFIVWYQCQIILEVSAFLQIGNTSGLWLVLSLIRKTYKHQNKKGRYTFSRLGGECFRALAGIDRH